MKSLQSKYNILHILYWISYLSIYGYIAIFLQYKGLSNTEIGIVSGAGALLSIFISPFYFFFSDKNTRIKHKKNNAHSLYTHVHCFSSFNIYSFTNQFDYDSLYLLTLCHGF